MFSFWLTGLPSSGKTTLGSLLWSSLASKGISVELIDGDDVRRTICSDLGFSDEDRRENIRRVAILAKQLNDSGKHVICCFVSPTSEIRDIARQIIGDKNFFEVFIDAPIDVCERRDVKGLYKKARQGLISNFTGVNSDFEVPATPNLHIKTSIYTIEESFEILLNAVLSTISNADNKH